MTFAILAAGEGSRLASEGLTTPKPLVEVGGEPMIDRLFRIFMQHDASEIVVICNDLSPQVRNHLQEIQHNGMKQQKVPLRFVVKTTPSSMHSLYELSHMIGEKPFCLTTVDTIFREDEFAEYITKFRAAINDGFDGVMGLTTYIDDEKPLYVGTDAEGVITGFYDECHDCRLISGGIYGLTPPAFATLRRCIVRGMGRMRNFQRAMVAEGLRLAAFEFSKVLDIDHVGDIAKAELFLSEDEA